MLLEAAQAAERKPVDREAVQNLLSAAADLGVAGLALDPALQQSLAFHQERCVSSARSISSASSHQEGNDDKQQICFDFTKGACLRGDMCKYSHDVDLIASINSQERGICFDHLKGQCHRGVLCRFSHDLSSIMAQHKQQAAVRPTRRNAPICYDFAKGQCLRGSACRYSHDLSLIGKQATEICHDFLRGRCHRGGLCRYAHLIPGQGQPMDPEETAALTKLVALLQLSMQTPATQAVQQQLMQQLQMQLGSRATVPLANAAGVKAAIAAANPMAQAGWPAAVPDYNQQLNQLLGMVQSLNLQTAAQSMMATGAGPHMTNKMPDLQTAQGTSLPTATTATSDDFRIHAAYIQAANNVLNGANANGMPQGIVPQRESLDPSLQHWDIMQRTAATQPLEPAAVQAMGPDGAVPANASVQVNPELLMHFRQIWDR